MNGKLFVGKIHAQNCNIIGDSVCKIAYDIPERNFSTFSVSIVSRSYDNRMINRKVFCKSGPCILLKQLTVSGSGISWAICMGYMQVCTSLQTDNHASTPLLSFLQAGCPSCRPTNSVKALKAAPHHITKQSNKISLL